MKRISQLIFLLLVLLPVCLPGATLAQTVTILHSFNDGSVDWDGANPEDELVQGPDGNFYGTTFFGGTTASTGRGYGTIFQITPSGTIKILHSFNDGSVADDGRNPVGGLIVGPDGNLYGMAQTGGSTATSTYPGSGAVYETTTGGIVTVLHSFDFNDTDDWGGFPFGDLTLGPGGVLFGTTESTIFQITTDADFDLLHRFGDGSVADDGWQSEASLVLGTDGNFYGTTAAGGAANWGTVFKMTPAGVVTILHSFGDGSVTNDGLFPQAGLVEGTDGNFYGTTSCGGSTINPSSIDGYGTIFRITPTGSVTILHNFLDGSVEYDGNDSLSALTLGSDGNFYGTLPFGGTAGKGVIFKMTPEGAITLLHSFSDGSVPNDGNFPAASLVLGTDGSFYGTTYFGGAESYGTVFKFTPAALPPPPPSGLTATSGNDQVGLSWDASAGATSYNVYEATTSGEEGNAPVSRGITNTSAAVTGLANGATYYFEVTAVGPGGESAKSGEVFASPYASVTYPAGLQMFSSPYAFSGVSPDALFGYSGVSLAVWSPTADAYALSPSSPADEIQIGQGYWARFPTPVTTSVPGVLALTTRNFDIPLSKGWNMIGDPFIQSVPVANLLFDGGTETFAEATTGLNPLIGGTLWAYSQSSGSYVAATSLMPDQGYWILASSNTDLQVPPP